ncbi:hypothetical protein Daus18300_014470 [Diaporthe australafricana]|uniref:Rhodopsin domain-containing protein n=1 Tax=Diaporthe australafricana TaxID=127596 RepID=A0ABR3VV17_9PEZI
MAQERNSLVNGVFGLISDLYILVIPLWLVSHLNLPPKRKLGVMGVFLTGLFILELNIGLICACMPVVALPFKAIGASLAASWNSIRNYSRARLLNRSSSKGIDEYNMTDSIPYKGAGHQLPQMVKGDGAITGLRSFMRRAYRSTAATNTQKTAPLTSTKETITFATLNLVDDSHEYHDQLKNIHCVETGGRDNRFGPHPVPQPPMPAVLQQGNLWQQNQLRYQKWASTGNFA